MDSPSASVKPCLEAAPKLVWRGVADQAGQVHGYDTFFGCDTPAAGPTSGLGRSTTTSSGPSTTSIDQGWLFSTSLSRAPRTTRILGRPSAWAGRPGPSRGGCWQPWGRSWTSWNSGEILESHFNQEIFNVVLQAMKCSVSVSLQSTTGTCLSTKKLTRWWLRASVM